MLEDPKCPGRPWYPFDKYEVLSKMLRSGLIHESVPSAVSAAIRFLSAYEIAHDIENFINSEEEEFEISLFEEVINVLNGAGFREEFSANIICTFFSAKIGRCLQKKDYDDIIIFSDLTQITIELLMSGFMGIPKIEKIKWILEKINDLPSKKMLRAINSSLSGDVEAKKFIINKLLPLWKRILSVWSNDDFDCKPEMLGIFFEFAEEFHEDPEILEFIARVNFRYGSYGADEAALRIAAKAAFLGSRGAWEFIREILDESGRRDDMVNVIVDLGIEKFCNR